jgi:hypothetical protein
MLGLLEEDSWGIHRYTFAKIKGAKMPDLGNGLMPMSLDLWGGLRGRGCCLGRGRS